ncbi:MAG: hypothetical protein M0Z76_06725 [Gammaproteobacteria bacterium]|nr:hypothetical protein [Gammaproteobacteria bacterium]
MRESMMTVAVAGAPDEYAGRAASQARRRALAQGKSALPPAAERTRAQVAGRDHPGAQQSSSATVPAVPVAPPGGAVAPTGALPVDTTAGLSGRALSMAHRRILSRGKEALKSWRGVAAPSAGRRQEAAAAPIPQSSSEGSRREMAQAARARNGQRENGAARPSGRVRPSRPLQYPPKVADSETYGSLRVTGVRIGRGSHVTGDEAGAVLPVTGTQYIGREGGYAPRTGGLKVGAARTANGQVVTGTQVRSQVKITGDESNAALRITGEADQELADDLRPRPEEAVCTDAQFQRMHDPHGHSVFGTNLGRSIAIAGSRVRGRTRHGAIEVTEGGQAISGTAVGLSQRVTGDDSGACRHITGDQYLTPAARQPLCATKGGPLQSAVAADAPGIGKTPTAQTWRYQNVTGVQVEHNPIVTGDEPGACAAVTGTPYVGPAQYETYCAKDDMDAALHKVAAPQTSQNRVTGDTPLHVEHVTGLCRGADRAISGTPYYRADAEEDTKTTGLERMATRFSVGSPQREAQLRASTKAIEAPSAAGRITGSFAVGEGKITGNREFHFSPRTGAESVAARARITGEGRMDGPAITGGAWAENSKITGTEDYIASERNPSQRAGKPHSFASAGLFKGKGRHDEPRQMVTGMVGWSARSAAKVTLSGGAQG